MRQRILLMYITEVSGHHQATIAIEKALTLLNPAVQTLNINGFSYAYPIVEKIVNKAYMGIIKRTPRIWDYLYDNPKVVKRTQSIKKAIHKSNHVKLAKLFGEFKPDAVVCTQAFPCGMVADYKKTYSMEFVLLGVLTDYAPHSYWVHEGVDYYIVPSQESKDRFIKEGISSDKIKLFGIPVAPKFTATLNKGLIAEQLNIDTSIPTILIMGGGQGLGPIRDIVKSVVSIENECQLIVVAGTNKKLITWLKSFCKKSPKRILTYEYADNIEELMEIATFIVTKPGGMTTTESLVKGLPMVIVNPIPGQELHNTNFLLKHGIAVKVDKAKEVGREIDALLSSPQRIARMRQAAFEHSRPSAAFDIAQLIQYV